MDKELIYKTAMLLEEKCRNRHAHDFYNELIKNDQDFLTNLFLAIKGFQFERLDFKKVRDTVGQMITKVSNFLYDLDPELDEKLWTVLEDLTTIYKPHKPQAHSGVNAVGVKEKQVFNKRGKVVKNDVRIEILLAPEDNVKGMTTVAHESGHILEERVQKKMKQKTDCIGEISSMFIEKLFADYLLKIGEIDIEQHQMLRKSYFQDLVSNARILFEEIEILSQLKVPITGKQLADLEEKYQGTPRYDILKERINCMVNGTKDGKELYGEYVYRYVIGEVVSELMCEDFKKNPQQTLEKYKQFLEVNAEISKDEAFSMLLGENYRHRMANAFDKESTRDKK